MGPTFLVHLLCADNHECWPPDVFGRALACLPEFMRDEVTAPRRWQDRQARLQGRLLLRRGLAGMGLARQIWSWTRGGKGKPRLAEGGAHFNISHGGSLTICALAREHPLGVDVEPCRELPLEDFVSAFTPAEMAAIRAAESPHGELLRLWTAKEAVVKAAGTGFMQDPAGLEISPGGAEVGGRRWRLASLDLGPDHLGHLAWPRDEPIIAIRRLSVREMLEGCA